MWWRRKCRQRASWEHRHVDQKTCWEIFFFSLLRSFWVEVYKDTSLNLLFRPDLVRWGTYTFALTLSLQLLTWWMRNKWTHDTLCVCRSAHRHGDLTLNAILVTIHSTCCQVTRRRSLMAFVSPYVAPQGIWSTERSIFFIWSIDHGVFGELSCTVLVQF